MEQLIYLVFPLEGLYPFYDDTANSFFVLEMPLAHKKSSVIFIMPYHVESLERLEKMLTRKQLDIWQSKLEQKAVAVSLPKISMEVSHNLQVKKLSIASNISTPAHAGRVLWLVFLGDLCGSGLILRERISLLSKELPVLRGLWLIR